MWRHHLGRLTDAPASFGAPAAAAQVNGSDTLPVTGETSAAARRVHAATLRLNLAHQEELTANVWLI